MKVADVIARLSAFPDDAEAVVLGSSGPVAVSAIGWAPMPGERSENDDPDALADPEGRPYVGVLLG